MPVKGDAPEPADFGLVGKGTLVPGADSDRWGGGIALESEACAVSVRIVDVCNTGTFVTSQEPTGEGFQEYLPFAVQVEYQCSTLGFNANDYWGKALRALELHQSAAIERELLKGELAKKASELSPDNPVPNRWLADGTAVDVTPAGGAVKPKVGVALLEQALANNQGGAKGVIHSPVAIGSVLADDYKVEDDTLRTPLGNTFITGAGYDGSGPNGEPQSGTSYWLYATGAIGVRLSEPSVTPDTMPEAVDRRVNHITVVAERLAAATWDGCSHFAVLVDLAKA